MEIGRRFTNAGLQSILAMSDKVAAQIAGCDIVHVGGNGLLRSLDGAPTAALLQAAKKNGAVTTYDLLAPSTDVLTDLETYLPYIDYFMPAMEEAAELVGCTTRMLSLIFIWSAALAHVSSNGVRAVRFMLPSQCANAFRRFRSTWWTPQVAVMPIAQGSWRLSQTGLNP